MKLGKPKTSSGEETHTKTESDIGISSHLGTKIYSFCVFYEFLIVVKTNSPG